MGRINSRTKGAVGEREFCKWLYDNFNIPMPERNLEQVRSGGSDIIDFEPFFFEVKRCELLDLDSWWIQVVSAVRKSHNAVAVPVVAFRQNRKQWEFLISAKNIGLDKGYMRLKERIFLQWSRNLLLELEKNKI